MSKNTLILFGHPAIQKSRVQSALISVAKKIESVTFHDLYETYPDLFIDVKKEQKLLSEHDTIIFQHPFYWYSAPAIFKEWCDLVLEYGFAYGPEGHALVNKKWVHAISTGGPQSAYQHDGHNRFTIKEFLTPWNQTAHLCGMQFLEPFVVHNALRIDQKNDLPLILSNYQKWLESLAHEHS